MKVLFLLTYYTPHWTGLTQYARRLAEGMSKRSHQVQVLTTNHTGELLEEETIAGVEVVRKKVNFRLSRTLVSLSFLLSFFSTIRKHEVIVIYMPFAEVLLAACIAKLWKRKLYLVHNGDLLLPKSLLKKPLEIFYQWTTSVSIALSDGIIVQTEDYSKHSLLLSQHAEKWKIILPLFEKMIVKEKQVQLLKEKITKKNDPIIGFAGRFVEEKGFDILLAAIPEILKKYPSAKFVFAGETNISYENFYSKQKTSINKWKNQLIFLGKLSQEAMGSFYQACNVFVISSRSDCFPSTEVEAMLCGTPVVVTDIPGARWAVEKTKMGLVVRANTPLALADGIIQVLQQEKKFASAHKQALDIFDYNKTMNTYEKLFFGK